MRINQLKTGEKVIVETRNTTYEITKRDGDFNITVQILKAKHPWNQDPRYFDPFNTQYAGQEFLSDVLEVSEYGFKFSPSASGGLRQTSSVIKVHVREDRVFRSMRSRDVVFAELKAKSDAYQALDRRLRGGTKVTIVPIDVEGLFDHYKRLIESKRKMFEVRLSDLNRGDEATIIRPVSGKSAEFNGVRVRRTGGSFNAVILDGKHQGFNLGGDYIVKDVTPEVKLSDLQPGDEATIVRCIEEPTCVRFNGRRVRRRDHTPFHGEVLDGDYEGAKLTMQYAVKDVTPEVKLSDLKPGDEATIVRCINYPDMKGHNGARVRRVNDADPRGVVLDTEWEGQPLSFDYIVKDVKTVSQQIREAFFAKTVKMTYGTVTCPWAYPSSLKDPLDIVREMLGIPACRKLHLVRIVPDFAAFSDVIHYALEN